MVSKDNLPSKSHSLQVPFDVMMNLKYFLLQRCFTRILKILLEAILESLEYFSQKQVDAFLRV